MKNLRELPKLRDSLSFLYLERTRVEQKHLGIAFYGDEGEVAVPAAALGLLQLGPGCSITHAAVRQLAENGCAVQWVGEHAVRFYAAGTGETRSAANLMRQARAWADEATRLEVVRRLYSLRFPEPLDAELSLQQIRGREGVRVREAYARASRTTGVPWRGRDYKRKDWEQGDVINRALSAANASLYGVAHAAIVALGYSPGLGFIHTGKQLSFVYDVADVYKADTTIPTAFAAVAAGNRDIESRVRVALRESFRESALLGRIVKDLDALFEGVDEAALPAGEADEDTYADDAALPGELWDPEANVTGGVSYGRDGVGEGSEESSG